MPKTNDPVDIASDDSFPASDPPSFTPVTGAGSPHNVEVVIVGDQKYIRVPHGRAEELLQHLAAHGITATIGKSDDDAIERVDLDAKADAEEVQTILDHWEQ